MKFWIYRTSWRSESSRAVNPPCDGAHYEGILPHYIGDPEGEPSWTVDLPDLEALVALTQTLAPEVGSNSIIVHPPGSYSAPLGMERLPRIEIYDDYRE